MTDRPGVLRDLVADAIANLRRKLLDLTLRNRLLNFKFSETSRRFVRVVDELPDELYSRLTEETTEPKKLFLHGLPEPDDADPIESTGTFLAALDEARLTDPEYVAAVNRHDTANAGDASRKLESDLKDRVRTSLGVPSGGRRRRQIDIASWARENGIDPSYDLPLPGAADNPAHRDNKIQTLLLPDALERKASALREDATLAAQELGLSTLHAAFGYLEWYESPDSSIPLYAPLLLLPVQIDRELRGHHYRYFIQCGTGQDPVINLTLRERLRSDFQLELPDLDEDETPESYFRRVGRAVRAQKRWRVRRFVVIGHFSFARLAMYEDLDATRWGESPPHEQPLVSAILAGSDSSDSDSYGDVYDVDDPAVEQCVPLLISDADSSQFSALVDAMSGRSFALQGPPGTGKSQTITNLIAAALAAGKSVLFVAEKLAALEVVAKRLGDAGLSPFLLELHSTKIQKSRLLESFKTRLQLGRSDNRRDGRTLNDTVVQLKRTRNELRRYIDVMNAPVGATGLTLHEVFWEEQQARGRLPGAALDILGKLRVDGAQDVNRAQLKERTRTIVEYAEQRRRVATVRGSVGDHPLYGLNRPGESEFEAQGLDDDLRALLESSSSGAGLLEKLNTAFQTSVEDRLRDFRDLGARLLAVPAVTDDVDPRILDALHQGQPQQELQSVCELLTLINSANERMSACFREPTKALAELQTIAGQLQALVDAIASISADDMTVDGAETLLGTEFASTSQVVQLCQLLGRFREILDLNAVPDSRSGVLALLDAVDAILAAGPDALAHRHAGLVASEAAGELERLRAEMTAVRESWARLSADFELGGAPSSNQLRALAAALETTGAIGYWFGSHGRRARRVLDGFGKKKGMPKAEVVAGFRSVADLLDQRSKLESSAALQQFAGRWAAGIDTPVAALIESANFIRQVTGRFAVLDSLRGVVGAALIHGEQRLLESAQSIDPALIEVSRRMIEGLPSGVSDSVTKYLENRLDAIRQAQNTLSRIRASGVRPDASVRAAVSSVQSATRALARQPGLDAASAWLSLHAPLALQCDVDLRRIRATLDHVIAVKSAQLPARITSALISRQAKARQALARQFGALLETAASKMLAEIERLVASRGLDPLAFMDVATIDDIRAGELRDFVAAALGLGDEAKSDWVAYRSRYRLVDQLGLGKLRNLVDSMDLAPEAAQAAYHVAHFRSVIGAATRAPNEIPDWSGLHLNGLRSNLAELDREYLAQSRKSVVDKLRRRDVPDGVSQGPVKSLTEKALIEHEIGKQRRHIPIRALLARAGSAAQALKPCFMMSPASVSQFLPAMPGWFDIVVIDEASQMRPEEAICAIARGRQAIIVGDPLQLPPTSFFDSTQAEVVAPEEEDGLDIDAESILDKALSALRPKRDLLWHYRSRHDSLIAFSNREFYADRLIVFPSPKRVSDQLGVQYVPVQDGRYKSSINPEEADMVVATVSQIIRDRPDRSIGVVAVNQPQKDLLIERFDRLFAEDSDLEAYRARWAPTLEEFFVKNLENVQGDERDIIVISTVYGPETPGGPVHQRFGPINSNVGHRRLNVLFTRAKERVVLVSSLKAEDIVISEASKPGVRALKRYLEYARSGRLEQGVTGHGTFESPFELEVAGVLQAHGFEVEPQVGVAGYRIDLAVRSRTNRDHFIVGIECDGATYHSAKSARDRDRLRQEILERLGWRLYRIWSADWFLHRDREVRRLAEHIESLQTAHVA